MYDPKLFGNAPSRKTLRNDPYDIDFLEKMAFMDDILRPT